MPKIKIHYFSADAPRLKMTDKGDWIDLYCAETMELHAGDFALVPLGVSMQLPAGYEARNTRYRPGKGRPHLPVPHLRDAAAHRI